MNRIRRGNVYALATVLCVLLAIFGVPHTAFADNNQQITVPEGTQNVWVDVESASATDLQVQGSMNDGNSKTDLTFKSSPNGVTAIAPVKGKTVSFALSAKSSEKALVAITFVDANDVILAESATNVTLTSREATITPVPPTKPTTTQPTPGKVTNPIAGVLQNTGAAIGVAAVAAIALAGAGAAVVVLRKSSVGRHSVKGDAR